MTITTRGAVGPTGDPGASSATDAPTQLDEEALDAIVNLVADHAPAWAKTDASARAQLLDQVIADTLAAQDDWLADACKAKGLIPGSTEAGEELFAGVGTFVRMARLYRDALHDIDRQGKPSFAGPVREAADGRLRVQVFPGGPLDRITFAQTTAEVWMQPGVTREAVVAGQASAYSDPVAAAGTVLVLHDTTELDYSGLQSIRDLGPIGGGLNRGGARPRRSSCQKDLPLSHNHFYWCQRPPHDDRCRDHGTGSGFLHN